GGEAVRGGHRLRAGRAHPGHRPQRRAPRVPEGRRRQHRAHPAGPARAARDRRRHRRRAVLRAARRGDDPGGPAHRPDAEERAGEPDRRPLRRALPGVRLPRDGAGGGRAGGAPLAPEGRPVKRGGLPQAALCALLSALLVLTPRTALALGPFEKNHPRVEEGMAAYEAGRFDDALAAFESARRELPDNAMAELGQPKDAIAAYRKALLLDPKDDLARHNLEVVLRDLPRPKRPQPQP